MQKSATIAVIHNNKLLLLRRGSGAKWKAGKYCLPGGRLEKNETLKDCAIRELYEEAGIVVYRDALSSLVVNYPEKKYSKVIFVTSINHQLVTLNYEHDKYAWVCLSETSEYDLVPGLRTSIKTLADSGYLI